MESNQDSAALAQQIQALAATVEELTRQNQEIKLRLQQEENQSKGNLEDEGDSQRRIDQPRPLFPEDRNFDLLQEMRKEMDELRSAINEKIEWSVDRLVRATDSPFTAAVLEVQCRQSSGCLSWNRSTGLKTLRTTLTPSRRHWAFSSHLTRYCVAPFPPLSKALQENGSLSCQRRQ